MSSLCVTTTVNSVDSLRNILEEMQLNDPTRRLKFLKDENLVAVPIKNTCTDSPSVFSAEDLKKKITSHKKCSFEQSSFHIRTLDLPVSKKLSLKSPLQLLMTELQNLVKKHDYVWTEEIIKDIPSHWERHGDLVLIPGTAFTLPLWTNIGTEVWSTVTKCLSCGRLARKCPVSIDHYRTPQVTMLYGSDTWAEHVDNGIRYTYDVTKCMFSAGNITEKLRVAGFRCNNEVVVDLYAGIGYFTLPYLVYTGVKHLYACEWNLDAVEALHRNLIINGVENRCTVLVGDNKKVCPKSVADRVNLGLIPSSHEGWPVACAALKPSIGGTLHIHYNVNTKPKTTGCNSSQGTEPLEMFRCEAKSQFSVDTATSIDTTSSTKTATEDHNSKNELTKSLVSSKSGHIDCEHKHHGSDGTDKSYDITDKISNSKDIGSDVSDRDTEIEHDDKAVMHRNINQCNKIENDVRNSKWYSWAVHTAQEIREILQGLHNNKWNINILYIEHVKSYAPYVDHVVLDLKCKPCLK